MEMSVQGDEILTALHKLMTSTEKRGDCKNPEFNSSEVKQIRKVLLDPVGTRLLTLLRHYGKPRPCINIHHYAPAIECSVMHRAATSFTAAGLSVLVKVQFQVLSR